MLGFSLPEILFLAALGLVVIGPKQLPEVARTVGRFLNELRRTSNSFTEEFKSQMKIDPIRFDERPLPPHYNQPPPAQDAIAEPEIVIPADHYDQHASNHMTQHTDQFPLQSTEHSADHMSDPHVVKPKDPGSENT